MSLCISPAPVDSDIVRSVLGPTFAGCMVAVGLSAVLGFQVFLYFRIFPSDALRYKVLVGWIWVLDVVHTVLLCTTMWRYLIVNFGNMPALNELFPTTAVEISITAITTLTVNGFYSWRIYKMSKHNWWLIGPIAFLSVSQVGLSLTSTVGFISAGVFTDIPHRIGNAFIASLVVSATSDVLISVARYYYLRNLKQGHWPTQEIVEIMDATLVFTINDGFLSCVVAIATVNLAMHNNNIYLGIYFTISKFYSNSVLATLNLRNWYRHRYAHPVGLSLMRPLTIDGQTVHHSGRSPLPNHSSSPSKHAYPNKINGTVVEVHTQRQVEYDISNLITNDAQANTEN
ncbi:hypothetical protein C8J55DRAFT_152369 [Lentinula edodes]|uniref:DUF6534 domain-containing protein n=1 Tax=Lentinula lateritia TaxID=40482 RepID=A0A9W9A2C1_9AGAR|nr:hypothetical protein C8J55DRAFT_152369 [Lentinula edodes]